MKSGLLLLAIAIVLGGLVGMLVVQDPGYVLVSYADMALETSLWFALMLLLGRRLKELVDNGWSWKKRC